MGVPIYWLNGNKVADDYADFYDEDWDEEAADKNELGANGPNTNNSGNYPLTGCDHDGTEAFSPGGSSLALGTDDVAGGRPNSTSSDHGPLSGAILDPTTNRPMYGLSAVFEVAAVVTNSDPTFSSSTADREVAENTAAGQNVGAVLTASDSDGDTLTYTLEGTDSASFALDTTTTAGSAQIQTKTGVTYNHEAKSSYTVVVKADDGGGGTAASVTVTITITDVNEAPERPAAPTVTATSGSTTSLSVSWTEPATSGPDIDDYDLRYREGASGNWSNGPQNVTATLASIGSLDAGTSYQVQVRATNDEGDSNWSPSGSGATTAEATPTVSISADKTSAVFKQDGISYTLTRSGSTTGALTVSVTLTQTKDFLLATALSRTVTIAAGQSTKTFTVAASSFQHFAAGTMVEGGTLTAAVQDVLGYDLGSPASVAVSIVIHSMIGLDQASYTIGEAGGTLTVKLIARTGPGAPQPASNTSTVELIPVDQTTSSGDFNASFIAYQFTSSQFSLTGGVWKVEESLAITITNDALDEDDETFDLEIEYRVGTQHSPLVDASGNSCGSKCTVTVTITDDDTAGVTVSKSSLTVTEQDTSGDSYTVVLDSQPTADVTISVGGQSGTDVTAAPTPMTFTTVNWATPVTVTVTGDDDADTTNDIVSLTHNAASGDSDYQGITIAGLTVSVNDNDTAQVTGLMVEPGNGQLVVQWTAVTGATGYQVQWKSGGQGYNNSGRRAVIGSGSTTSHTIPSLSNGTEYTVRVRATRTGANAGAYSSEVLETPVMPTAAGVTVSKSALTLTEQDTTGDTYTVVLDRLPTASVTVTVGGLGSSDVTANPSSLTFTTVNWATPQMVTVTAGNDADTTNDTVSLSHSAMSSDSAYQGITIAGLTVTVNDNDTAQVTGLMVEPGNAQLAVEWTAVTGATGYELQWKSGVQSYNTSGRQATISSGSTTSHTIPSLTNGTEYTVRVRATRTGANAGAYSVEVLETPVMPTAAGVTVSKSALTLTEQDTTGDTYTVVLNTLPTATVTVTVGGLGSSDLTANPSSLTFTTVNWATAQTVTVTAGNDADTTNDTVSLSHSAMSGDSAYQGITIAGLTVTVNDNDTAQVTGLMVEPGNAQLAVQWTAVTGATGYELQWKSGVQSYNNSRRAVISSGSTTSHTIPSLSNGTEYTVRVRATRTGANAGAYSVEVLETPVMPTAAGVTVSKSALTLTEQDTTGDTYTVVLNTLPTASVTVTVGGLGSSDVSANPSSLTFTTGNWATAQTVTVTAGDDADTTNDTVSLTHSAMSSDGDYQGITIAGLTVTVADNDTGNTPAEGKPTISGPAQVGRTLTASTAEITDAEGLTTVTYSYQWLASGTVIGGAMSSTYSVSASVQGDTIAVRVTFDDDEDNPETLTSNATNNAVVPAAVTCPAGTLWCSTLTAGYGTANMDGEFFLGLGAGIGTPPESYGSLDDGAFTHLGVAYTVTQFFVDADTGTAAFATSPNLPDDGAGLTLQVQQVSGQREIPLSGKPYFSVPYLPATTKAWQLGFALNSSVLDPLTAPLLRRSSRVYDPYGNQTDEDTEVTVWLSYANRPAEGGPTISGRAQVGETLTAGIGDIADADGLPTTFPGDYALQWLRVDADGVSNETPIGAGAVTYTPVAADLGKKLKVQVSFSDDGGGSETLTSDAYPSSGTITDGSTAGVTVSKLALTVTEEDSSGDTYTVVLNTQPTASVTVTVGGLGSSDLTANPASLTFTTVNWQTAQTVTVTAGSDTDLTDDTVALSHSAASSDSAYQGITIAGLTVTVADNDDPPPPPPPGVRALVSNLYETPASTGTEFETVAQPFTTGSNPDGYVLTSVELRADDTTDDTRFQVQIVTLDGDGQPSAALYTLSNPASIEDGPLTFTAPASANLAADTSYAVQVLISSANGGPNPGATLDVTPSWDEDLALYGWSIANTRFKRASDTDPWSSSFTRLVQLRIRGAFYIGASNNATLAALTLADAADDSAIALNESVAAGTTAYTAEVEDGVETITINAETADDGATVAFLDGSGAALADADATADGWQVRLDPSATTIQMTVTAENASTRTYTLTLVVIDTSDATLRSLSLSEVALSRTFSPDVTSYTASVADSVLSTTVTANPAQPEATAVVMLDGVEDSDGAVDLTEDSTSFSITVVVTAPNRTSTRTYTVTVNRGSVAVTGTTGGGGGGGGAPPVAVPSDADFDWNVTRDIESLDPDHDAPTDIWSDGRTLWVLQNSATGADTVFAYESDSGERRADREFELDRRNRFAHGIWSDGATVWVADSGQDTLFAYDLGSGERLEQRDIELAEDNRDPRGIWSDGETIYVLDSVQDAIFAYDLESGELLAEYPLATLNQSPRGIWSDGVTIWVSDDGAKRIFAYRIEGGVLVRYEAEEFTFRSLLKAGNGDARGIWSDGDVIFVADEQDDKLYSYNLPDAINANLAALSLSDVEIGAFSPLRTSYEAAIGAATQTTVSAQPVREDASVSIVPADADPADGHQVAFAGLDEIAVTVTSPDGSRTRVYRVSLEPGLTPVDQTPPASDETPPQPADAGGESSSEPSSDETAVEVTSEVRITVRNAPDGRVEFALQQRAADGSWGERLLPRGRFLAADAALGRWLFSTPVAITVGGEILELRIGARRLEDGRVEFALQRRTADGSWSGRLLPSARYLPAGTEAGRWLASSALDVDSAGSLNVRIAARRLDGGRVEFALQQQSADGAWGERNLPSGRFLPVGTEVGRWLASSAVNVGEAAAGAVVRIAARRAADDRVEFALQQQSADGSWGERHPPSSRFLPAGAEIDRWLASSALAVSLADAP